MSPAHQIVHRFFAAVSAGELPDDLFTADMAAWTTTQGDLDRATYFNAIRILRRMCKEPIAFTIDAITAEEDRVCAELRSTAMLIDDQPYANTYFFAFRLRDGKIAHVAEHFNALIVQARLYPVMQLLSRQ